MSNQASVAYIARADGRILCVWNKRYGGWTLPGGLVEFGETADEAMRRELREETSLEALEWSQLFCGDHDLPVDVSRASFVRVFQVTLCTGIPREVEIGCPVTWLLREEFMKWSPFAKFYRGRLP